MPIDWPDRYAPGRVAVSVSNEIIISAPPETVWHWLIRAAAWPSWYPNAKNVRIEGGATRLSPGARFTWQTFGVTVRSTVAEFAPYERLAWTGTAFLLDIYHAWLLEPHLDGTRVVTEENQNGLAARAQAFFMPARMFKGHALWLSQLNLQAKCNDVSDDFHVDDRLKAGMRPSA